MGEFGEDGLRFARHGKIMNPSQTKALILFGSAVALALSLGWAIADGNFTFCFVLVAVVVFTAIVVTPGYVPLIVFGILTPFTLPLPFIWNFPFLGLTLGLALTKYFFERGLVTRKAFSGPSAMTFSYGVFFAWVLCRYCLNPSMPNLMGFGRNVTGFRAWLTYGSSFTLVLFLGRFLANREGIVKLARFLAAVSFGFALFLIIVGLSKSMSAALVLRYLGMFVVPYGNGFLRFVALGEFGLILISLVMLPNLLKLNRPQWWASLLVGTAAIILCGNRSTLAMAFIIVVTIPWLRKKYLQVAMTLGAVLAIAIVGFVVGPALSQLPGAEFLVRPLALISPQLAQSTGGDNDMEWREAQWELAKQQIREHPMIGRGYGGVENAFEATTQDQVLDATYEIDLATGGIHNCYISAALALGIPAALLFIYIFISQIVANARRAYRLQKEDPVLSEAHCFVCGHVLAYAAASFVAMDANDPTIWFLLGLGVFVSRLRRSEIKRTRPRSALMHSVAEAQIA